MYIARSIDEKPPASNAPLTPSLVATNNEPKIDKDFVFAASYMKRNSSMDVPSYWRFLAGKNLYLVLFCFYSVYVASPSTDRHQLIILNRNDSQRVFPDSLDSGFRH